MVTDDGLVCWQEDLLAKENPNRIRYIDALKQADKGDYLALITSYIKLDSYTMV